MSLVGHIEYVVCITLQSIKMEKEFIPYEQALYLKELGFDEPCFKYWNDYGKTSINRFQLLDKIDEWSQDYVEAPLYQQAFRWFREKYQLHGKVGIYHFIENTYCYNIVSKNAPHYIHKESQFETYEEAELECLIKLIDIVKEKK
jgi:hypothetical protein